MEAKPAQQNIQDSFLNTARKERHNITIYLVSGVTVSYTHLDVYKRQVPHSQHPPVIQDLYERMDRLIGRVMEKIDDDTLLMVISDHGFKSFARCMNVNAWLHQNGYLALKDGKTESGDWFEDVDWSRTRA